MIIEEVRGAIGGNPEDLLAHRVSLIQIYEIVGSRLSDLSLPEYNHQRGNTGGEFEGSSD